MRGVGLGGDGAGLDPAEVGARERVGVGERGGGLALAGGAARAGERGAPGLAALVQRGEDAARGPRRSAGSAPTG